MAKTHASCPHLEWLQLAYDTEKGRLDDIQSLSVALNHDTTDFNIEPNTIGHQIAFIIDYLFGCFLENKKIKKHGKNVESDIHYMYM